MDELTRKKILLLSPDFGFGGAERSIAHLSTLLANSYDVLFIVFNRDIPQVYNVAGKIYSLDISASRTWLGKLLGFMRRIIRLRNIKKKEKPDVCISFLEGSDYLNVLSRQSETVILSVRGSKFYDPNIKGTLGYFRHRIAIPWLYRNADSIVTVDKGIEDELRNIYKLPTRVRCKIIPNFYDVEELNNKSMEQISDNWNPFFKNHQVIVASGRLAEEKGFHYLIKVFAMLMNENQNARLVLIGSGPMKETLLRICAENGLKACLKEPDMAGECRVVFADYMNNPFPLIARSKIFILSSITEGFPNALVEAMCLGVPVMAANCPYGPASILGPRIKNDYGHEFGILLPAPGDDMNILIIWKNQIELLLRDEASQRFYRSQSLRRSAYYNAQRALNDWKSIIEK
jgi:glycosyltransferase involved in cell wall biosynthesis